MWVKICGTTNLADAQLAIAAGADAIGFVFASRSKRKVLVAHVAELISALPETIATVGVFTEGDARQIAQTACECGLTAVQLHFGYHPVLVAELRTLLNPESRIIQALQCSADSFDEAALRSQLDAATDDENLWGILLDATTKDLPGGTGLRFDWMRVAQVLANEWPQRTSGQGPRLILAGGLNPENLREAVGLFRPFGVDVVSGVETAPGRKDAARVHAFVHTARLA